MVDVIDTRSPCVTVALTRVINLRLGNTPLEPVAVNAHDGTLELLATAFATSVNVRSLIQRSSVEAAACEGRAPHPLPRDPRDLVTLNA